ncbi:MAG: hypothetical protein M3178_10970 [Pseudomonadota bacterium]|nr:hypothetical protein [Pseudomonadota bacterium]
MLQGTGGSAAVPWRIVELNCSRHYTLIIYISTKLLLIGIIKNYNRGGFSLAVISIVPASIHIVSRGLPIRKEEVLQAFGEDREAWSFPITGNHLIGKESLRIPIDGEGERRPRAGQLDNSLLVRRKERLRPFGTIPI